MLTTKMMLTDVLHTVCSLPHRTKNTVDCEYINIYIASPKGLPTLNAKLREVAFVNTNMGKARSCHTVLCCQYTDSEKEYVSSVEQAGVWSSAELTDN